MSTVIVDTALREKLLATGNEIVFRDARGNLLAHVIKSVGSFGYVMDAVLTSAEERGRIERQSTPVATDQVMDRIRPSGVRVSTVCVDEAARQRLLAAKGDINFLDEGGNLIARCRRLSELLALVTEWPTAEELDRIAKDDKGSYTPEQVMERLRSLTKFDPLTSGESVP